MENNLFRKKSVERITSPEQLNERIRIANPGIWIFLSGIILVLIGVCVWGVFGRMDTLLTVSSITKEDKTVCYVKEKDLDNITPGMPVRVGEVELEIEEISTQPIKVDSGFPEYLCYIGGLSVGEWVYEIRLNEIYGQPGNINSVDIVTESIAPISFVIN